MLDIAIVGGGLTGLAVAKSLEQKGFNYHLFEARERLGGRVLSRPCPVSAISVDLGPTWYWPQTQPAMVKLVAELGLTAFPQSDDGTVWVLTDPNEKPRKVVNENLHGGALRIDGGMARLTEAIAARLPQHRVAPAHVLTSLHDMGTHVEMVFRTPQREIVQAARRVVLAVPPRLIEEPILFTPTLPSPIEQALLARPTWMARQAKAVVTYGHVTDFSAQAGSGNAFLHHEQAVFGEVFDASSMDGHTPALGGFLALPPAERTRFRNGMEMLVTSEFVQLFGAAFERGELHYQDWATEPFTCASMDRRDGAIPAHPHMGDPTLQGELWGRKLWFAGSEFAAQQAGYLEGALIDAERVAAKLTEPALAHALEPQKQQVWEERA